MWPADGDPGWPGIIKGSSDNHIGEVDVSEVNYASNDTLFSTFHFFDPNASGNNGQIQLVPITFPAGSGDMADMHDFDVIWGPGSLLIKVDGVVQLSAPAGQVRADFAHGGCNYTLGAQMAMQATSRAQLRSLARLRHHNDRQRAQIDQPTADVRVADPARTCG